MLRKIGADLLGFWAPCVFGWPVLLNLGGAQAPHVADFPPDAPSFVQMCNKCLCPSAADPPFLGEFLAGADTHQDESAVWDWISNVAVMVGLVLLVAGVYAGLGLAAGTTGGAGDADGDGAGRGGDGNPPTLVGE